VGSSSLKREVVDVGEIVDRTGVGNHVVARRGAGAGIPGLAPMPRALKRVGRRIEDGRDRLSHRGGLTSEDTDVVSSPLEPPAPAVDQELL
jgi:hypothetical protein